MYWKIYWLSIFIMLSIIAFVFNSVYTMEQLEKQHHTHYHHEL